MNKNIFNFILTNTEKINLELKDSLNDIHYCHRAKIFLTQTNQKILLSHDSIYYDMERFSIFLQKALNNELQLHSSMTQDIGYLYNQYYQNKKGFVIYNFINGGPAWIGYKYHVWEACKNKIRFITWIYNDKNGNIIFEVTPCFPYLFCEPEEEPNYIPYDEWIKTYKPYLIRTLSREIAQEWLNQAEFLIKTIDEYVRKWEEAQK